MSSDPAIETRFVPANGLTFEVDVCGDDDRLALLLHGFPECSYSWRHQMPFLARLGYTVWAPNLRGYGRSSKPPRVLDYAMPHLVADVAGLIDAAGKKSTLLVGHDWGGGVGWHFAMNPPRPIEGYIALNCPHPAMLMAHLLRWPQIAKSWYMFLFQIPGLPEWLLTRNGAVAIGDAFRNTAVDKSRFPDEVLDVYRRNALIPGAMTAMLNWYRALFRTMSRWRGKATPIIDVPTLLIWGERDHALGKELSVDTEKHVRDLTVKYLPGASHWVQQDAPDEVNRIIEEWLQSRAFI
jgi:pimeloyl-ACP methyl ester carboxylesterase